MKNLTKKNRKNFAFPFAAKKITTTTTILQIDSNYRSSSAGVSSAAGHRLPFDLFAKKIIKKYKNKKNSLFKGTRTSGPHMKIEQQLMEVDLCRRVFCIVSQ